MANDILDYFDLDMLPPISPEKSDEGPDVGSKMKQLDNLNLIMSGDVNDCFSQDTAQDGEQINYSSSNDAFADRAVDLLDLPAIIDNTSTSQEAAQDEEVLLNSDQLEIILQNTGIVGKTNQDPVEPLSEDTNQGKCSIIVISLQAENADCNVSPTITTSGHQSQDVPARVIKKGRHRRKRKEGLKVYELPKLDDKEQEKKRQNAINSKKNRDQKKQELINLRLKCEQLVKERDELKIEVEESKAKKRKLEAKFELVKEAFERAVE